ncbi:hypothetical protein RchiOBHm_Chr2g0151261 [Rosa chinensis]|uniref:Uncharacterized protein n=1 Tax=Rosa chinensis TaxID=74649 RepID=A0A2P6S034_ROSCH|nr:hypothetical protein RchiOBHm_Chr2g0151261 [Rosa chinensis]
MRADLKISLISSATNAFKSWERLDVGGIISHSFELEAKTKGLFSGATAVITFRFPSKAALQESVDAFISYVVKNIGFS